MVFRPLLPELQATLLCEDVRQEINGMHTLVGVFTVIPAASLPVRLLKLCVWTRWVNGEGTYRQHARILTPNQVVIAEAALEFEMLGVDSQATNVHFFAGVQFGELGIHHVEILLNDEIAIRFPLIIAQAPQPHGPAVPPTVG